MHRWRACVVITFVFKCQTRAKPEYQERKVNTTEEGTQWKGAVPLEKKDEEFFSGTRVCLAWSYLP